MKTKRSKNVSWRVEFIQESDPWQEIGGEWPTPEGAQEARKYYLGKGVFQDVRIVKVVTTITETVVTP